MSLYAIHPKYKINTITFDIYTTISSFIQNLTPVGQCIPMLVVISVHFTGSNVQFKS